MERTLWMILLLTAVVGLPTSRALAAESPMTPTETAAAYLSAMESSDLDAAEALFAEDSSIFETGGVEGTWQHYRAHHIGPELDAIESFVIARGEATEGLSADGSMAFVTWPMEYKIALADGRLIDSRGTVSFVLQLQEGRYLIRHLHWSSRRKPAESG